VDSLAKRTWIFATIALLALGSAVAYAATEDDQIHACVAEGSALIRSVDTSDQCRKNERALSWNARGPEGDPGPAGPPGLSGVELVRGESESLPTGVLRPSVDVSATCPTGKVALSGGATLNMSAAFVVLGSPVVPEGGSAPTGWTSFVTTVSGGALPGSSNVVATAYAICASAE
jgi:hypothetical protein